MNRYNDPIITEKTVFARNCEVRRIDRAAADAFICENHIYGKAACRHCYGLFRRRATGAAELRGLSGEEKALARNGGNAAVDLERERSMARSGGNATVDLGGKDSAPAGELVAVGCFSNARRWVKGGRTVCSYEWVRYASLRDTRVVGGMGKILKAFIADVHPDDVMTYAISSVAPGRETREGVEAEGNAFRRLGFTEEGRKEFPSRIPGVETPSVSIKFRLKLTQW